MAQESYVWKKMQDKQDMPPGLADLIKEAYVLVYNGAEYVGLFIHDQGRCWIGYRENTSGVSQSLVCSDPDEGRRRAETMMVAGILAPRRRTRF